MSSAPLAEFGRYLRELRESKQWSREDLAEKASISEKTIERWEKGEISHPRYSTFELYAEAFDLKIDDLIKRYKDSTASEEYHTANSPQDNNQTVTTTPSDTTVITPSSSNEWEPRNKVVLSLFIINVAFVVGAVYFFLQEGIVTYIIGSVLGILAVYDIALIPLLNSHDIDQRLKKWLRLPEAANSKRVINRIASIKISLLLLTILTLTVTLRLLSVNISGEVSCVGGEQVKGVWVQSVNGSSGFAS